MAFASIGRAGSTANATVNSSNMVITLNGQAGTGANVTDLLVYSVGTQNQTTINDTDGGIVTSVVDSKNNNWVKVRETQRGTAVVQSGAVCSLWFTNVETALTTSDTVTATFSNPATCDAQAGIIWRFSKSGAAVRAADSTRVTGTSSIPGSLDLAQNGTEFVRFRGVTARTSITVFTTSAGWTTIGTTRSGTANGAVAMFGEFAITTASTLASNPTINGVVSATASIYADFEETALMGDSIF